MVAKYSPSEHLIQLTQSWIGTTLIIGAVLFPLLGLMDYFVSPELFTRFISYRIIISFLLCVLYVLNKLKRSTPYQYIIISVGTALSAATIELAVVQHGGQSSTYYAGMGLVAICALGFVPISLSLAYALVAVIYGIYLVPILLTESITNGVFISNNGFMISTFTVALIWRHYNQKLIMTELTLREELSRDKEKLSHYSTRLEDLVAEKTGALAVSEQRYRELFENANDGIAVLDKDGIIVNVNSQFCKIHGYDPPEVLGALCPLIEVEPGSREVADRMKCILNGEAIVYETEHLRKDGSRVSLEVSSKAITIGGTLYIQSFHRDITEKKKLQDQLLQSQKMESMGVLAGGIAHDFNNILTAILGHAEVLRRRVRTDEFAQKRVKTIEDSARRAGQMVSKLLSFARKENFELIPTDLNGVVKDTIELLERTFIDRKIATRVELAPELPAVKGDSIHLEQVITNLVMNAMDAMSRGGVITITTSLAELRNDASLMHPLLTAGRYAVLRVADTGAGISPEILDRSSTRFSRPNPSARAPGWGSPWCTESSRAIKERSGSRAAWERGPRSRSFSRPLTGLYRPSRRNRRKHCSLRRAGMKRSSWWMMKRTFYHLSRTSSTPMDTRCWWRTTRCMPWTCFGAYPRRSTWSSRTYSCRSWTAASCHGRSRR